LLKNFLEPAKAMNAKIAFAILILSGFAAVAFAEEVDVGKLPPPSNRKDLTFEKDIKPIFDKSCVKCHGAEKAKGRLRLDTLAGTLKGNVDGKVLEPGNSAKSILVRNIAHVGEEDDWMPPVNGDDRIPPLTEEQVGLVRAWIDQGAK
jgi:uncharacterized membrane protein